MKLRGHTKLRGHRTEQKQIVRGHRTKQKQIVRDESHRGPQNAVSEIHARYARRMVGSSLSAYHIVEDAKLRAIQREASQHWVVAAGARHIYRGARVFHDLQFEGLGLIGP